jgi:hypothetical protein
LSLISGWARDYTRAAVATVSSTSGNNEVVGGFNFCLQRSMT